MLLSQRLTAIAKLAPASNMGQGLSIHYSHLGEDPMLMGAAAIATAEVFKNPRMLYRDE